MKPLNSNNEGRFARFYISISRYFVFFPCSFICCSPSEHWVYAGVSLSFFSNSGSVRSWDSNARS